MSHTDILAKGYEVRAAAENAAIEQLHMYRMTTDEMGSVVARPPYAAIRSIPDLFTPLANRFTGAIAGARGIIRGDDSDEDSLSDCIQTLLGTQAVDGLASVETGLDLPHTSDAQMQGYTARELGECLWETRHAARKQKLALKALNQALGAMDKALEATRGDLIDIGDEAAGMLNAINPNGAADLSGEAATGLRITAKFIDWGTNPIGIITDGMRFVAANIDGPSGARNCAITGPWIEDIIEQLAASIDEIHNGLKAKEHEIGDKLDVLSDFLEGDGRGEILPIRVQKTGNAI